MQILSDFFKPFTSTRNSKNKPFATSFFLKTAICIIVVLSLLAGYYHAVFLAEKRKYLRLEDMYVRVRSQIGREAMQDLIDASYEPIEER
jgi:hypothetical protein